MTLRVYIADLTHVGPGDTVATESFPLNVGLIGAYAKKCFGGDVDVRLFKYPADLLAAIRERRPHILGCSNYTWNSNLAYYFTSMVKAESPETLTVWGGTNYPFAPAPQEKFLRRRAALDVHVYYEGENAFAGVIERALSSRSLRDVLDRPLGGCQFIHPESDDFVSGAGLPRIRSLDDIPSPYVAGLMDEFFDGLLTPLVETARGCPFSCNFCNAGDTYFNKVNRFSDDYVREELTYIARKASALDIGHVTFADNNFGMIPRDDVTAKVIYDLKQRYGWPKTMTVWTGKNAKERVIEVTRLLKDTVRISMSVQSMDPEVLKEVKRDNIKLDHYRAIAKDLDDQGRRQHAEVIMPLPGETLSSHLKGLDELLDTRLSNIQSHTLQMLHGTPYKDDDKYVEEHGYVTKYRLVPLDFSRINGDHIFDVEEVGIATNTFSFDEYLDARVYLLIIDLCFSSGVFRPLFRHLAVQDISVSEFIHHIFDRRGNFPDGIKAVFDSFVTDSRDELWNSEEELITHYSRPEVFEKLLSGDVGGNVLFKHRIWTLTKHAESWVKFAFHSAFELCGQPSATGRAKDELTAIENYVLGTVSDCYTPGALDAEVSLPLGYDVMTWLSKPGGIPLSDFALETPETVSFRFRPEDKSVLRDGFKRYGVDIGGLVKLTQRVVTMPFRVPSNVSGDFSDAAAVDHRNLPTAAGGMSPGNCSV